jgi:D-aspartate ligase
MAANLKTWAQTAVEQSLDPAQRAAFPVAIVNNDWAPTLAFAYSLGRQNVPLHFYGPGVGRWSRYCRRHGVCPPVGQADLFLPWLQARLRSGEITRLAPTTDLIAYYTAVLREDFPAEVRRSIAPLHEIEQCLIKTRFSAACEIAGQDVPSQAAPDDTHGAVMAARSLGYPLIIKPKSHLVVGTSERGQLVHNEAQLRRAYRRYAVAPGQAQVAAEYPELRWPLLQRYLPSAQHCVYSVSGIKDVDRGILAATLTSKQEQWPPDIGVSTVQTVCNDKRILAAGLATVDKLLPCGIFELELLTDGEKLMAIDLNPRAFGFVMLDIAVGNDLPWLWWQTTLDMAELPKKQTNHAALECRFIVPYYFKRGIHRLFGLRGRPSSPSATSASAPWISMVGHRSDPLPMLLANLRLLRLLPHRGGLVRPYIAAAWRSRGIARKQTA